MGKAEECKNCKRRLKSLAHGVCAYCDPEAYHKYYTHLTEKKKWEINVKNVEKNFTVVGAVNIVVIYVGEKEI